MKKYFILLELCAFIICGCARHNEESTVTLIRTPSMVCGSCAKTIKNAIVRIEGVEDVNSDLDKKTVSVKYLPSKVNLEKLEQAITAAGYDANDKKRDKDAYDKLDKCCKIDG